MTEFDLEVSITVRSKGWTTRTVVELQAEHVEGDVLELTANSLASDAIDRTVLAVQPTREVPE